MKRLLSIIVIMGYVISLTGCITGSGAIKGDNKTSLSVGEGESKTSLAVKTGEISYLGIAPDSSSEEEAIFDAKWSAIEQALKEVIGDEAVEKGDLIKEKFRKEQDNSKFLGDWRRLYVRKEYGKYAAKVNAAIDMAALREEAQDIIESSGGGVKPTIAIKISRDKDKGKGNQFVGKLGELFKDYGYGLVKDKNNDTNNDTNKDTITSKHELMININSSEKDLSKMEIDELFRKTDADYLVEFSSIKYIDRGINKITGKHDAALNFTIIVSSMEEILAQTDAMVKYSDKHDVLEELLYKKAAKVVFNKINSHIINSWEAKLFTVNIGNDIGEDERDDILDVLGGVLGDNRPREKDGKAFFKLSSGNVIDLEKRRAIREGIKEIYRSKGLSDDISVRCRNNTVTIGK